MHELLKNIFNNKNNYIINYDKYNYNPFETNIIKRKLFKQNNNSCRLYSAFFLVAFIIYGYSNFIDLNKNILSYLVYNIGEYIIKLKENEYERGIWPIIDKFYKI